MNCQARRENILLFAADGLDAAEKAELRDHLATGCPFCTGVLAEAQSVLALLPRSLTKMAAPANARDRLMDRVRASQATTQAPKLMPRQAGLRKDPTSGVGWKWVISAAMGSAAIAASVTLAVVWGPFREGRQVIGAKDLRLVSLDGTAAQPGSRGRIFWDRDKNDWRLYVFDLAPPPPGRTYELWFITPAGPVAAGTFDVGNGGRGSLEVPLPPNIGAVAAAAISDEPAGGSQSPTGKIRLLGKIE